MELHINEASVAIEHDKAGEEHRSRLGESGVYLTSADSIGKLYRMLVREHGRCTGKIYVDEPNGKARSIGWVFVKRKPYDGRNVTEPKTYLHETWVSVHTGPDTVKRTVNYATL